MRYQIILECIGKLHLGFLCTTIRKGKSVHSRNNHDKTCLSMHLYSSSPEEMFKNAGFALASQHLPQDLATLMHEKTGEVGASWNWFKPFSKEVLLTVPRFFCGSFMLFLLCFCYAFMHICLLMPYGHLLGEGWPLGSRLGCLIVKMSLSHRYPGSGAWLYLFWIFALFLTLISIFI